MVHILTVSEFSNKFWRHWKGVKYVIQLKLKRGESVERALKRLKKIMDKEGLLKQLRNNRYYEKPCEKARHKSARARARTNSRRGMREMF